MRWPIAVFWRLFLVESLYIIAASAIMIPLWLMSTGKPFGWVHVAVVLTMIAVFAFGTAIRERFPSVERPTVFILVGAVVGFIFPQLFAFVTMFAGFLVWLIWKAIPGIREELELESVLRKRTKLGKKS